MLAKIIESLNDLHYFYVVANEKSFTKAAKTLFVSQPAVTKRIKNLENRLGFTLIKREKNVIELTEYGKIVYKRLNRLFEELKRLDEDLKILKRTDVVREVSIGSPPSYSEYLLPDIIRKFTILYPKLKIKLYSDSSENLINLVLNNKIDLAIIALWKRLNVSQFNFYPLKKEEIVFVCSKNHPFAEHLISFEELKNAEFIIRDPSSGTRKFIEEKLKSRGIKLNIKMEAENYSLIKNLVKNSNAVSFLAKTTVNNELKEGILKQFYLPEKFEIDIGIITNKNTCPELKSFIEILQTF